MSGFYQKYGKRLFDLTLVLASLPVWLPLIAIVALIVRLKLGSPVFFTQPRAGKNGKIFHLTKFRSMTDGRDAQGNLLPDKDRLPPFGIWLRASSLDELPGLFQVLAGTMSLVGPRPLLTEYLPLYNEHQSHRHDVLPGLTGWAQVNGRNAISWDEKFDLDVSYVNSVSFKLDIKIIVMTLAKVIKRDGINSSDSATMEKFTGNNSTGK